MTNRHPSPPASRVLPLSRPWWPGAAFILVCAGPLLFLAWAFILPFIQAASESWAPPGGWPWPAVIALDLAFLGGAAAIIWMVIGWYRPEFREDGVHERGLGGGRFFLWSDIDRVEFAPGFKLNLYVGDKKMAIFWGAFWNPDRFFSMLRERIPATAFAVRIAPQIPPPAGAFRAPLAEPAAFDLGWRPFRLALLLLPLPTGTVLALVWATATGLGGRIQDFGPLLAMDILALGMVTWMLRYRVLDLPRRITIDGLHDAAGRLIVEWKGLRVVGFTGRQVRFVTDRRAEDVRWDVLADPQRALKAIAQHLEWVAPGVWQELPGLPESDGPRGLAAALIASWESARARERWDEAIATLLLVGMGAALVLVVLGRVSEGYILMIGQFPLLLWIGARGGLRRGRSMERVALGIIRGDYTMEAQHGVR